MPYSQVLSRVCQRAFGVSEPALSDMVTMSTFIQAAADQAWRAFFWPDICLWEKRQFRANWNDQTDYTVGTQVRYRPGAGYFQVVQANIDTAPYAGATQTEWWFQCQEAYSGREHAFGLVIKRGDIITHPLTGDAYGCHTQHTATLVFDTSKMTLLTPFVRSVEYLEASATAIDGVERVVALDPRIFGDDQDDIPFVLGEKVVVHTDLDEVWMRVRPQVQLWDGVVHQEGETYDAGAQVYAANYAANGNAVAGWDWYRAKQQTSDTPRTSAHWTKLPVPYVFREAVPLEAFAQYLEADGHLEKARGLHDQAARLLAREIELLERQQNQAQPMKVRTR